MDERSWEFAASRGAWYFADAITLEDGQICPWFSQNAWHIYLQADIDDDESSTRLPDVWNYFVDVAD